MQAKDDKYTSIIWEVRKHILEQKDELDRLLRKKDEADRQLAAVCPCNRLTMPAASAHDFVGTHAVLCPIVCRILRSRCGEYVLLRPSTGPLTQGDDGRCRLDLIA